MSSPIDPEQPSDLVGTLGKLIGLGSQVFGVVLLTVGAFYLVKVLTNVLAILTDVAAGTAAIDGMMRLIDGDKLIVKLPEQELAIGRFVAMSLLFFWYVLAAWIPLALIRAGGSIAAWNFRERFENRALFREFLRIHGELIGKANEIARSRPK